MVIPGEGSDFCFVMLSLDNHLIYEPLTTREKLQLFHLKKKINFVGSSDKKL